MDQNVHELLPKSLETGFLNASIGSSGEFRPHLVLNDPPRSKVLTTLLKELESCTSFEFSVAFITAGGLAMLQQGLHDAEARNVRGKILTSDYLNFTDPNAIEHLMTKFSNIEVRVYSEKSFHAKGYLFHHGDKGYSSLVLGSSNITHGALATNREWNVHLVSLTEGELLVKTQEEFDLVWQEAVVVSPAWLEQYRKIHESFRRNSGFLPILGGEPIPEKEYREGEIIPNYMQCEALASLDELRSQGESKALLISATGTGKTFLAAFDVENQKPNRFLFVVHRQQIAQEALRSFQQILGKEISCGLLGGGTSEIDVQYLFSMVQTLSKDEILHSFTPDHFDYIVVDEVHHSGASSYRKVLSYFKPSFLLGMTATPERTDDVDIYSLFDHNIAYEIRLNQALEADLLCPFHYYGIADLSVDNESLDDLSLFSSVEIGQRIVQIKQMLDRYSIGTYRRRGLIFCSRNKDAQEISAGLNALGLKTLDVSGADSAYARDDAFARLEMDEGEGMLEYLVTVDILNEGVDIPSLNQVVMVRPTQSAIIFVQQLGRGLRKFPGKEYLTVIDFIANYSNNYMIPIALYGDNSYKKDTLRRFVSGGSLSLQGSSTVSFDKIAKERIYASINTASFQRKNLLKEEFMKVRSKVGRIPTMMDFIRLYAITPLAFIEYSKNYYQFKSCIGLVGHAELSPLHLKSLNFLSKVLCYGQRPYEAILLSALMQRKKGLSVVILQELVREAYGFIAEKSSIQSAIDILQGGFFKKAQAVSFGELPYCVWEQGSLVPTKGFITLLENKTYQTEVADILALGEFEYRQHYLEGRDEHDLVLYQKYTRQEVCRLLNWNKDESATIYGYTVHKATRTCPIFVTYHKDRVNIDASIDYHDKFLSRDMFQWETRNSVRLGSVEPQYIRGELGPMQILLFVQKCNDEGRAFYYMGELAFVSDEQKQKTNNKGKVLPVVEMHFRVHPSVQADLYSYIIEKVENGEEGAVSAG
ncbi:MAG: DEAD/DEAH box helicase [Sphaerochaeta sp.]|nr:DEAD/DEAH box helicase [Sphaerochaeta sp.]